MFILFNLKKLEQQIHSDIIYKENMNYYKLDY